MSEAVSLDGVLTGADLATPLDYRVVDHVGCITLNRPERRNAIDTELLAALWQAFDAVRADDDVWVVLLRGAGPSFCTGHDLRSDLDPKAAPEPPGRTTNDLYVALSTFAKPVVAAVQGHCLAQGAGLALLADMRVASDDLQLGFPQVKRGIGSVSGPASFVHSLPFGIALELLLTGEALTAERALHFGVVNRVVAPGELDDAAMQLARAVAANAPLAVRGMKEAAVRGVGLPFPDRVLLAKLILEKLYKTADAREGITAFFEKREPTWQGR